MIAQRGACGESPVAINDVYARDVQLEALF